VDTNTVVTLPAPTLPLRGNPHSKWEREYLAFQRLLPQLLLTHRGQYVALHEEQVVDSDTDEIALILRVHTRHGYVPIHVDLVTEQPPRPVRVPHYREYRPESAT
jgi:hypothetical protein